MLVQPLFSRRFEDILGKALSLRSLSGPEVVLLLGLKEKAEISMLFETARALRERFFGPKIFAYGFVYFSTYCRNNCRFCSSRISNKQKTRYRKSESEITRAAISLARSGVHLIDLTMGEDPRFYGRNEEFAGLAELAGILKRETGLPLMISPGAVSEKTLRLFAGAGVDWYACYQETHSRRLFEELRPEQSYDERMLKKSLAKSLGLLIEEGIMAGVGETNADIADSVSAMREMGAHQTRVMSFIPQAGTPMADRHSPRRLRELLIIAVLRLAFPDRLIPASLDIDGRAYLKERLAAGANVVTSLIPPSMGLSGVSQASLDIDEGNRTIQGIVPVLNEIGLELAAPEDYQDWVGVERKKLQRQTLNCEAEI